MTQYLFNICDFGAVGDGITKDTAALQKAIDACHEAGGGRVLLNAGRYLCGTIYLKSNVNLHLAAGATIFGSPIANDYNNEDVFPENQAFAGDTVTTRHLLIDYRQENVSITGEGTIDGNSSTFFEPLPAGQISTYRSSGGNFPIKEWRPSQMVFFCRCKNVAVRDVQLLNSPYWTLFLLGCDDVKIRGLQIENLPSTKNGDGIDVDCRRNVTISDCIIRSGDDCITIRANKNALGENAQPCENIVASNCVLSSPCNAIRVGVGDGIIRNGLFNNIVIPIVSQGISIVSLYRKGPFSQHDTCIENVHFSDFIIDADFHDEMPATLSHHGYHGRDNNPALPCAIYAADVEEFICENLRLRWQEISAVWRDGLRFERVADVDLQQGVLRQPQQDGGAAVLCCACSDITVAGCRAAAGTSTFLQVEESAENSQLRCTSFEHGLYSCRGHVPVINPA